MPFLLVRAPVGMAYRVRALIDNYNARPRGARLSFSFTRSRPGAASSEPPHHCGTIALTECSPESPDSEPALAASFEYVVRTTGSSAPAATGDLDAHPTATTPAAQGL